MAEGLIVRFQNSVSFAEVLECAHGILLQLLKTQSVPGLKADLPPTQRDATLEGRQVDAEFPGACISLEGVDGSLVSFGALAIGKDLQLGCTAYGRTPASEVLTAALAIAGAWLTGGKIIDAAWHWSEREECTAAELMEKLAVQDSQRDFAQAINLVHNRQRTQNDSFHT